MKPSGCPVHAAIIFLEEIMASDSPKTPKTWRILEEISALLKDIAWGSAGEDHLDFLLGLSEELAGDAHTGGVADIGNKLMETLARHREVFESHVATHNCAAGDCLKLTPAPCQMTCPAGIDVPTYVTLIGEGRDAEAIEVIRRDNPFPWVCGLVCTRPCEFMCVRGRIDQPVAIKGSDYLMAADVVISAIGQRVDHEALAQVEGLNWTRRDTIDVNMATMETSLAGVFAAGDAVTGPATVIEAIGGGKRAADAIHRYFEGIPQPQMPPVPVRRGRADMFQVPASTNMVLKRPEMPLLGLDRRRTMFQQVELGYSENMVREEARRCLRCDICRRCGDCVAVCRDKMGIDALNLGYLDFDHPVATDFRQTEEKCILCGACAANCPNDAMTIEDRGGERLLSLCGTILNRQKLIYCADCQTAIGPLKYIGYIKKRTPAFNSPGAAAMLCETCARKRHARYGDEMTTV